MTSQRHIPALDGVRGLAFLLVFFCHYGGGASSPHRLVRWIGETARSGYSGLCLFYVLSGFLITGILWDSRQSGRYLRGFYLRRVLRTLPLYYATLILIALTALLCGTLRENLPVLRWFFLHCQNFGFAGTFSNIPLNAQHLWSLAVEEQFYLVWPVALLLPKTLQQAKALCTAVFAGSLIFRLLGALSILHVAKLDQHPFSRAGELAAGAFIALTLRQSKSDWERLQRFAPFALAVSFVLLIALYATADHPANIFDTLIVSAFVLFAVFFGALLLLALQPGSFVQRLFSLRWLRSLGRISYGMYIFHLLFQPEFRMLAARIAGARSPNTVLLLQLPIAFGCSLLLAALSFRFFESPILALKRYVPRIERPISLDPKAEE